jgi:hypothetical protein
LERKSVRFQVNRELLEDSSTKAVKEEFRDVVWPVYEYYEEVEEDGEPFVVAPISHASFFETEPAEEYFTGEEKPYRVQRFSGRWPLQDAMTLYAPLQAPELVLELADLAEKRYRQILWIGFSGHAATFSSVASTSSPFVNSAPALTNATR